MLMMQKFDNSGAEINVIDNYEGLSPLGYACKYNDIVMADLLLNANAIVSLKDENGSTAFHTAVENENVDMVKLLLSYGADINVKMQKENSLKLPLIKAIRNY